MAGVKGRSGRKSTTDNSKRQRIIDKAWDYVESVLDDPKAPQSMKADIAKSIIVKNIPQEVEHSGEMEMTVKVKHEELESRLNCFLPN